MRRIPIIGSLARRLYRTFVKRAPFRGSADYWRTRYAEGGDSGAGSYARFAAFKADVLNRLVRDHEITSLIEIGCGDGNQLSYAAYPSYLGLDISPDAIRTCREQFAGDPSKRFQLLEEYRGEPADAALSLDVVYHLIEDEVFEDYMVRLFEAAERYVVIYSSDTDDNPPDQDPHVRHRSISRWVIAHRPDWTRIAHIPNRYPYAGDPLTGTFSEFHIFGRRGSGD